MKVRDEHFVADFFRIGRMQARPRKGERGQSLREGTRRADRSGAGEADRRAGEDRADRRGFLRGIGGAGRRAGGEAPFCGGIGSVNSRRMLFLNLSDGQNSVFRCVDFRPSP